MANLMTYHMDHDEYVGETDDGREVHVDSGEISESIAYAVKADGVDLDALFDTDRAAWQAAYDQYRDMQLDPDDWSGMDRDNDHVRTLCALCGCHSAVPESAENGTLDGCACECHEDGIARGRKEAAASDE